MAYSSQQQIKVTLSQTINNFVKQRAKLLGMPSTQFVKYLIVREMEEKGYPAYAASEDLIKAKQEAMDDIGQAIYLKSIEELDSIVEKF